MGVAIPRRRFLADVHGRYQRPVFFCCGIAGATDGAMPLNVPLAKRLLAVSSRMRSVRLAGCLDDVLSGLPDGVVICDFDVLFSPAYDIDVVSLLVNAYRRRHFDAAWPGTFDGHRLIYAEEGYPDYRTFDIHRYDITCVY